MAPATAGAASERRENIRSDDWPQELDERYFDESKQVRFNQDGLDTAVHILGDGRLDIHIDEHRPMVAGLLKRIQRRALPSDLDLERTESTEPIPSDEGKYFPLQLNIVIQVIGSRGDIQPFVALGKELKVHGHRVRLATHLAFREFVLDGGLEFFDIGGDPAELMAFMVKNPGLLPGLKTIRSGAVQKRRREMKQIIDGCWRSCFETGDGTHLHQIKEDPWSDTVDYRRRPFVADAIIANPPSMAHIHCAQRLGIPLHIMFTMPWSPTQSFPHPLATIHRQGCKPSVANFVSYAVVDMMVWEGLGDIVNRIRKNTLGLNPLDSITAPSLLHRLQVPHAYLWSPSLLPKPPDWPDKIDICGFSFLPSTTSYTPPKEIDTFLKAGPTPIYVGFGSIVVDDPVRLTKIVYEAVKKSGQRAIISKGWGNLGADEVDVPENILLIENCPHDWLFRQVSCVIHHGGAGTTAIALSLGRPTIIVPFFGDQQFWGEIVARVGAGPTPIPRKQLTLQNLSEAIEKALEPSTLEKAQAIGKNMQKESGVHGGVCSFHRHLDLQTLRCAICPSRPAAWHVKHTKIALSAFAATVLVEMGKIETGSLVLHRPVEYDTYRDPAGPISASAQVLFGAITNFVTGLADVPAEIMIDLVSASRALGHPQEQFHPGQCRRGGISRQGNVEIENEHLQQEQEEDQAGPGEKDTQDDITDEDGENHVSDNPQTSTLDRKRNLQFEKSQTMSSETTSSNPNNVLSEAMFQGRKMSKKFLRLILLLPTDLSLSMAKGFHNAPKLYHDPMVKATPKVIGIRSGFRAARKELRDGFYFGITGLVTQPRYGLKHNGAKGLFKGVGKGVGGVVLKPPAGLWGLAGYPLSGLLRNVNDSLGKSQKCCVVASRISQGHEEMRASTAQERAEVVRKWVVIEENLKKMSK